MKKVGIGLVLLLALAAITMYVTRQDSTSTIRSERSDFALQDTSMVDQIILTDEAGERIELRKAEGVWIVNELYKARPDAIETLLTTMRKLTVRAPISEQMMSTVNKNIIASHTLVEIYNENELIKSYYVGGPDKEHTGTFMLMKGSSRPFLMHIEGFHGFLTPRYFTNLLEWRDRGIFEYSQPQLERIEMTFIDHPERNVKIERGDNGFEVFVGTPWVSAPSIDSFMLSAYLKSYEMIHFESYEETKSEAFLDSVKLSEPIFKLAVTNRAGGRTMVQGFRKPIKEGYDPEGNEIDYDLDRLYLWIDSNELVIGQYAIFDKLTKGINFIDPV